MTKRRSARRRATSLALPLLMMASAAGGSAVAMDNVGTLQCHTEGGIFHFGATRGVSCVFHGASGRNEAYAGQIGDIHLGLRTAGTGVMVWNVLASRMDLPAGELAGSYADTSGGGERNLVDGSDRTIALRPASTGGAFNVATGIGTLDLGALMMVPAEAERTAHHRTIPAIGHPDTSPGEHYGCGPYVHIVSGDTMSGIARQCGVSLEALMRANPDIRDVRALRIGETVSIPSHVAVHGTSPCGTHVTLHQGESLQDAAWRCGVTIHSLLSENSSIPSLGGLHEGLVLALPPEHATGGPLTIVADAPAAQAFAPRAPSANFADGMAGGPDVWHVTGVQPGHRLNVRAGPSTVNAIVGYVSAGAALSNQGCRTLDGVRWCQVASLDGDGMRGWVAGSYLSEGADPHPVHTTPVAAITRRAAPVAATAAAPMRTAAAPDTRDRTERVRFDAGSSGTTLRGTVTGQQTVDYVLGASAGQTMAVDLSAAGSTYFNILPPGSTGEAIFVGSSDGNVFEQELGANGDYTIRLYNMGNDRDAGETVSFRLRVAITGSAAPSAPAGASPDDAVVPGTGFHATGEVSCDAGGVGTRCPFGVVRRGGGSADITITRPDGRTRIVFFENGEALGSDASEADSDGEFSARRNGDITIVTIGSERYEIFDAIVFGG